MSDAGLTLTRVFNAPRERVFEVWTEPSYVSQWWGVEGCTIVRCDLDVRRDGSFRIDMRTQDGTVYVNRGVYIDVALNERIEYRDERDANAAPGAIPAGVHLTTFESIEGGTLVTLTSRFNTVDERDLMIRLGVVNGIQESFDRLERLLHAHESIQPSKGN